MRYSFSNVVRRGKTKIFTSLSIVTVVVVGLVSSAAFIPALAHADSLGTNFESFSTGTVNGQDGWSSTGAAGSGCAVYDHAVVDNTGASYSYPTFGTKSLRISDAVTSGCFGDQTFSKSLVDEAGEADAVNGGLSGGTRQPHFEAQFDLASTKADVQPGQHFSVSPDRGDGARMSYLRFEDQTDGIHVFFDDVTDPTHAVDAATFNESEITVLNRSAPHTIKFSIDFFNGADNDVVKIYIDGNLVKTGTSWEDYYRFNTESQGSPHDVSLENKSRTIDSLLFRSSGDSHPANAGFGYLVDNYSGFSGPLPSLGKALGFVTGGLTLTNPRQQISFNAFDYGVNSPNDYGTVEYQNFEYPGGLHYTAPVTCAWVSGTNARFVFQIPAGFPGLSGLYVLVSVHDGGSPGAKYDNYGHTATGDLTTAKNWCESGAGVTNYTITGGNLVVHKN